MYRIVAHSYPNNEIRLTYSAIPNPRPFIYETPLESSDNDELEISSNPLPSCSLASVHLTNESIEKKSSSPLSLVPNSKPERSSAGYGALPVRPTTFGLNAKRQLIRSGAALEHEAPPEECLFLTGTLPGSTVDAFTAIAAYSGYIVNSLKAWIAKRVTQKLDFYCWEYQKRGALHLHYCCHIPDESDRLYILSEFREWWISCLSRVGNRANCDLFRKNSEWTWLSDLSKVRAVAEVCRKSPARYLAKYLSKSAAPARGSARAFTPSRWWGTSRPLKTLLESLTKVVEIVISNYHGTIKKLQDVKHVCCSSDSVTYGYRHKYGIGETLVCYPSSELENSHLWTSLESLSTMSVINSVSTSRPPSEILKVHKIKLIEWSAYWSQSLTESFQGLKASLLEFWNTMQALIPSQSQEPLHLLMFWAARLSDIRSLCRFTPALSKNDDRMIQEALDDLESCMKLVCDRGWF